MTNARAKFVIELIDTGNGYEDSVDYLERIYGAEEITDNEIYNQALEDFKSKWIDRVNKAYKSINTINVLCTMCNDIIEDLKR